VKQRLSSIAGASKAGIIREEAGVVWARVFPRDKTRNGEFARAVADAVTASGWKFEELHTEEGRLDEVFRRITLPDTVGGATTHPNKVTGGKE
jgi:ABC-2 type transport system ATP-binding protein